MSEHASSDVADRIAAVAGLASMVRTRSRKLYREANELRALAARLEASAESLKTDTEGIRDSA